MTATTTAPIEELVTAGSPRVLLAPITITPCKPLTLSHLKGLLWTDVMYRATARLASVTYRYSHTTYHPTEQTAGFWEHLDRTLGDTDYSGMTEQEIGELYVAYRATGHRPDAASLHPYREAVEWSGWVHPATTRVLELWRAHYARLGMYDPGLTRHQPPGFSLDAMLDRLGHLGMCLDQRSYGGPVYLDATRFGLPLRTIVTADGRPNYLACALRELLPLAAEHDEVVLLYDHELDADYQLLQRALSACGPQVHRVTVGRVPIDGRVLSARHGDWRGNTAAELIDAASENHGPEALRLGVRLYFIATLGCGRQESYRPDLLHGCLNRAARLLSAGGPAEDPAEAADLAACVARHRRDHVYVDPYRLTTSLLARRRRGPVRSLLAGVFT